MTDVEPEKAGEVREQEGGHGAAAVGHGGGATRTNQELVALRASLVEAGPRRYADKIRAVEEQMKDRAVQLQRDSERAAAARERVRDALLEQYPFLPKELHGIPLEDLPLRDDDEFVDAEQEHARLAAEPVRSAVTLRAAEDRMRARAEKVADVAAATEEALRERLPFVEVGKVPAAQHGAGVVAGVRGAAGAAGGAGQGPGGGEGAGGAAAGEGHGGPGQAAGLRRGGGDAVRRGEGGRPARALPVPAGGAGAGCVASGGARDGTTPSSAR
ncbi:hypothetical_protein [Leishmania infantum]|uniref:Hypothetical_protein n=1 Tax=Leishmania infantum TaxID=5671 RepID=A0A6L0WTK8_LEIIN|nr:hypothetical_protein [Leishmania infantum]SUZ40446.1 hypothetical_protein [Leishmania infantum]